MTSGAEQGPANRLLVCKIPKTSMIPRTSLVSILALMLLGSDGWLPQTSAIHFRGNQTGKAKPNTGATAKAKRQDAKQAGRKKGPNVIILLADMPFVPPAHLEALRRSADVPGMFT